MLVSEIIARPPVHRREAISKYRKGRATDKQTNTLTKKCNVTQYIFFIKKNKNCKSKHKSKTKF